MEGKVSDTIKLRAKEAKFDERLALLGLLLEGISQDFRIVCEEEKGIQELMKILKGLRASFARKGADSIKRYEDEISKRRNEILNGKKAATLSKEQELFLNQMAHWYIPKQKLKYMVKYGTRLILNIHMYTKKKK